MWCACCAVIGGASCWFTDFADQESTISVPLDGSAEGAGAMDAGGETGAEGTAASNSDGGDSGVGNSSAGGEAWSGDCGSFDGSTQAGGTCGSANWDCVTGAVCFFQINQPVCGSLASLPDGAVTQCCGNILCGEGCWCSDPANSHCSCP